MDLHYPINDPYLSLVQKTSLSVTTDGTNSTIATYGLELD